MYKLISDLCHYDSIFQSMTVLPVGSSCTEKTGPLAKQMKNDDANNQNTTFTLKYFQWHKTYLGNALSTGALSGS